jgi:hypothetical protein
MKSRVDTRTPVLAALAMRVGTYLLIGGASSGSKHPELLREHRMLHRAVLLTACALGLWMEASVSIASER